MSSLREGAESLSSESQHLAQSLERHVYLLSESITSKSCRVERKERNEEGRNEDIPRRTVRSYYNHSSL